MCAVAAVLTALTVLAPPPPETTPVVVAARRVESAVTLTAADLRVAAVPEGAVQPGALTRIEDAAGRQVIAPLAAGEAVTATRLVARTTTEGLPRGRTAVHLEVLDPQSLDLVPVGGHVRVYPGAGGPAIVDDAIVLAVDPPSGSGPSGSWSESGGTAPRGALLAVLPSDADRLLSAPVDLDGGRSMSLLLLPTTLN